jgi:hypothetical protein
LAGTVTTSGSLTLNLDYYGATQGSLLYRGSGAWATLGPGSAGQVLISGGAGANPAWGASTGGITSITAGAGLTGGTITSSGTIALSYPAAGLFYSTGSAFGSLTLAGALSYAAGTLSATGGGGSAWQITDGTRTVTGVTDLIIAGGGGTRAGSGTGTATLDIGGGGGGSLPASAPLLSSNSGGSATTTNIGAGLNLVGGVLSATDVQPPFNDFHPGSLTGTQTILRWILGQDYQAPAGTPNWIVSSGWTATSATTLTLAQNGTTLCTGVVPAAGNQCTLVVGSGFAGVMGDIVTLKGPGTADATFADIATLFTFGTSIAATVWNPFDKNASITLSNANLTASFGGSGWEGVRGSNSRAAGLVYFETEFAAFGGLTGVGLANASAALNEFVGFDANSVGYNTYNDALFFNGSSLGNLGGHAVGDYFAVCLKAGSSPDLWIARITGGTRGDWNGDALANPSTNTRGLNSATFFNGALSSLLSGALFPIGCAQSTATINANFGASAFQASLPSGAAAWG